MKRMGLFIALLVSLASSSSATEILRWQRLPLPIHLVVGQERVILMERDVRVGVPAWLGERLRIQTAGGAIYLRANSPIEPTRLQLQDAENGALILLDIVAVPATIDQPPLEPIRIINDEQPVARSRDNEGNAAAHGLRVEERPQPIRTTPVAVTLTRYAAQSLYAPLRTVEPVSGIAPVPVTRNLAFDTLLPMLPVRARALMAWRLDDHWLTAIKLTNTADRWITLDPRALQGDFVAATFQHPNLGPAGNSTDTTVLYLITRGHGIAEALLPSISPFDASINLPVPERNEGTQP
jgi:integrating conjugative element protein (TIGR03749 family)